MYERLLIPCALIPEFWLRVSQLSDAIVRFKPCLQYAAFLEPSNPDQARSTLQRGDHLMISPPISYKIAMATFEEANSGVERARQIYQTIAATKESTYSLEFLVRYANFEKRNGNKDFGSKLFKDAAGNVRLIIADVLLTSSCLVAHADIPDTRAFLAIEHARYLRRCGDPKSARDVLLVCAALEFIARFDHLTSGY